MSNVLNHITTTLNNSKKRVTGIFMFSFLMAYASFASAAGATADTGTVTAITDGFEGLKLTALAVVAAIAGIAILLFAAPFAWQYGKKVFKTVAR
ncbi:hypothetical protein ACFTQ7_24625 [Lysinibacillus sp. NPDC056959]|uniref:hypothetical protein n=1 Tax=Lysinibacillus sp. NPDC056959 TaxID=3345981 RepID=UPI0036416BE4